VPEWHEALRLAGERETLGLYLTGHPIARYQRDLRFLVSGRIGDYAAEQKPLAGESVRWSEARTVTVAGLILEVRRRGTRVSFILDDRSGRIEVMLSDEVFQRLRELVVRDAIVLVEGALRFDEFSDAWRIAARQMQLLDAVRERQARTLVLDWPEQAGEALQAQLAALLSEWRGGACAVALRCSGAGVAGTLLLGPEWKLRPVPQLIDALEALCGAGSVRLSYAPPLGPASAASA